MTLENYASISQFCRMVGWSRKKYYDARTRNLTPRETRVETGYPRISPEDVEEWRRAIDDPDGPDAAALRDWHARRLNPTGPRAIELAERREAVRLVKVAAASSRSRAA